ncbi:MAG: hypothetical protein NTZ26_05915 [Candidatus Aminicenantes bacterium]|nr:hypothetical protein [Candidatus Aminicenantes bacterium]
MTFNVAPQGAKAAGGRWERIVETEPGIKFPSEYKFGDQFLTSDSVKLNPLHHFRVTFHPIPNWGTPDPVDFQVERDGLTVTGQYRTMSGTLVVTIQPAEVASAGARWAVNSMDAPWRRSGESAGIVVGTYDLLFDRYDASRWNPPSHTTLRINPNTTTNFTATFTRK